MRPRTRSGCIAVAFLAASVCLTHAGDSASAYWRSAGHGNGTSTTGSLSVEAAAVTGYTAASTLIPGGSAEVVFSVTNPASNNGPLTVVAVTAAGSISSNASGCGAADVTFAAQSGLSGPVIAAGTTSTVRIANALTMSTSASNACQGATFRIPLTIQVKR